MPVQLLRPDPRCDRRSDRSSAGPWLSEKPGRAKVSRPNITQASAPTLITTCGADRLYYRVGSRLVGFFVFVFFKALLFILDIHGLALNASFHQDPASICTMVRVPGCWGLKPYQQLWSYHDKSKVGNLFSL